MLWSVVVVEKTLESPLDCKEIEPVHPKRNQSWIFIGKTDFEAETPNILAIWCEELTHLKRPWCREWLKVGREGDNRGWDGWMASLTQWTELEQTQRDSEGQGSLACCSPWGCKGSDMIESLYSNNVVQFSSVAQPCLTLCNPMDCSIPGSPVLHYLQEFVQIYVLSISDAIQPSHLLSPSSPLTLLFTLGG